MEKVGSKQVTAIALMTAFCIMGDSMMYIVLPVYWKSFGLTAVWQVGILLSVNRLIRLPLNPFVGWVYKKFDKKWALCFSVILAAFTTFSYGIFHQFLSILVMRALWGVSWSFLRLGGFLAILDITTDRTRGGLIGRYNGLWRLGSLLGMLAGGFFVDSFGITLITSVFAILALCGLLFIFRAVPNGKNVNETTTKISNSEPTLFWKNRYVLGVLVTGLIISMVYMGILASTLSELIKYTSHLKLHILGLTLAAASLAGIVQAIRWAWEPFLAPMFGKWSDGKHGRIPLLIIGLIGSSFLFILAALPVPFLLLLILLLLIQVGATLLTTLSDALAADAASQSSKIAVMTAYTVIIDLGASLGPSLAYFIIEWLNVTAAYQLTAMLLGFTGIVWLLYRLIARGMKKTRSIESH